MSKSNILLEVTNGMWFIEPSAIDANMALLQSFLKGDTKLLDQKITPVLSLFAADGSVTKPEWDWQQGGFVMNAPEPDTVAVFRVSGAIMKYDYCGALGTLTYSSFLDMIANNPNIIAAVVIYDTPGGTVAGTENFANKIANFPKPILSAVEDLMCSAGYWMGSAGKKIYSLSKTSRIGSIGTMISFMDLQPMYEKEGAIFHEVYATDSKDKNKDFQEARKKNYGQLIKTLDGINDVFKSSVIANRGDKLNVEETTTGKVFFAKDAIANGLIDGMKSLDEIINEARDMGLEQKALVQSNNNNLKTQNTMKVKATFAAMTAFLAASFTGYKADETELTEEHLSKMNAELETMAAVKADLKTAQEAAQAAAEKAKTDLETANASIEKLTSEKAAAEAEVTKLKGASAGSTTTKKDGEDDFGAKNDANDFTSDSDVALAASRKALGYDK